MSNRAELDSTRVTRGFFKEIVEQSDRAAAITAASVLDALLEETILRRLMPLARDREEALFRGPNKPLATFSAKIEMAFALGLYSNEERLKPHRIRDIRNRFAHRIEPLKFSEPSIRALIRSARTTTPRRLNPRQQFIGLVVGEILFFYAMLSTPDFRITRPQLAPSFEDAVDRIVQTAAERRAVKRRKRVVTS
jgi:hypothetical protein